MSVKSLKRQLAAAIVMVLVAIIALGSSTFAWFANNTKVTAEGMSITALSEGANLEISWADSSDAWTANAGKTTIGNTEATRDSATIAATELLPTHYVVTDETNFVGKAEKGGATLAAGDWVHTFSNKYDAKASTDAYTYTSSVMEKVAALVPTSPATTDWALVVPIYLRMNPNSSSGITGLKATAEISTTASDSADQKMLNAARVLYVVDDAVVGTGAASGTTVEGLGDVAAPSSGTSEVKTVYAVIYIDGEDASCTSANYNTEDWTVSIAFEGDIA